ncbi:anthranilate synthase, component I [Abditibacterium utsteinense]|uniref:Anthranilate synthase component 1 n=1 Tax=Abditibacterium utsteinense TaxID=1960156 RepID=A0A2S8SVC4_9BACT|nr:anthranilate synthase component I [Abditibacterium utsteinense]PQV64752.1 anthranilate synthase, component I [Abditibacterium utsteinense]
MSFPQTIPSRDEFLELATRGNLIPVRVEVLADLETPVSAFLKLRAAFGDGDCFLLESVEGGENVARYSFLGASSRGFLKCKNREVVLNLDGEEKCFDLTKNEDPLHVLESVMADFRFVDVPGLPRFCGGAVGFLGWEMVRFFEKLPAAPPDDRDIPDCHFLFTDTILVFDAVRHTVTILNNAKIEGDAGAAYDLAGQKIERVLRALREEIAVGTLLPVFEPTEPEPKSNFASRAAFESAVSQCIEYIHAGDCVQVVPSQRFSVPLDGAAPFEVYRALRHISPAPYMVFLSLDETQLVAASPEILVTEDKGLILSRPLAGTRKRGANSEEDAVLEAELLADPKEIAEHVMLVDLARNDLGRVCEYGSVRAIPEKLMRVERFSHVMHITSDVVGKLRADKTAYDVLRATFPAGTLSGAPKVRAMQIIDELEPTQRGPYGGAMGYFSFNGNMDTCITLRTIVVKDGIAHVQAGGGVVADSVPANEYEETRNKARAALRAIELAKNAAKQS